MKISEELVWRGFYKQATFTNPEQIDNQEFTIYLGTDPTASSLHVGHLAVYMLVRQFLMRGHKVVLLVGGGTGVIGDPGGKTDERQLLSTQQIETNTQALAEQVSRLFSGQEFELVDNYDWLKDVSILDFLRDVGKHFSMTQLVGRDFIATRMGEGGSGISYAEFSYTLLQGYDYWHLHKTRGVNLQIGGSDQWGNILSGVDLVRKKELTEVHGMTAPLIINKSTGRKFGKSEGGAVWLDPALTSPYKFYQFWMNVDDESAVDYLKIFTTLDSEKIQAIIADHLTDQSQRLAQQALAANVTELVHGQERRQSVEKVTDVLFGRAEFSSLSEREVDDLASEIPVESAGQSIIDIMVSSGSAQSNGEARRLITGGAVSLNGQKITENMTVDQPSLIKKGKNNFILVR